MMKRSVCLRWAWPFGVLLLLPALGAEEGVRVTREIKAAIEMAQRYMASQQRSDGSYNGTHGQLTGIVASCTLAYMATGNLPGEGAYARQVSRGIQFLLNNSQPSGLLLKPGTQEGPMYNHGLATLCLAEAWGMTRDSRIADKLERAIQLHIRTQGPRGSWTYEPKMQDGDMSITIMQVLALRAAKDAGVAVPKETIDRAIRFVESCRCPPDSQGLTGFGYSSPSGPKFSTTSAAVMSLQVCGDYRPQAIKGGLDYILNQRKTGQDKGSWYMYGHYYAGQAMFQASRHPAFLKYWKFWYPDVTTDLIAKQSKSGPNRGEFRVEGAPGLLGTAWPVLVLAIPYNYLPIYQK